MAGCVFWVDRTKYGMYEEQKIAEAQIKRESQINIENRTVSSHKPTAKPKELCGGMERFNQESSSVSS